MTLSSSSSAAAQVNRFNKSTDRALLVTDAYVYKLDPNKQNKVLKRLPLNAVSTDGAHAHTHTHQNQESRASSSVSLDGIPQGPRRDP